MTAGTEGSAEQADPVLDRTRRGEPVVVVDVRPAASRIRRPLKGAVPIGLDELQRLARRVDILQDLARRDGVSTFSPIGHVYFGRRFGWLPARDELVVAFAEDEARASAAAEALRRIGLPEVDRATGPASSWSADLPRSWHRAATLNRRWIRRLGAAAGALLAAWAVVELTGA